MSAIPEVKLETLDISTAIITDTADTTTTTTTATITDTTDTSTTTATSDISTATTTATTTTTVTTTATSNTEEGKKNSAENLVPSCTKQNGSESEQLHSDAVKNSEAEKTSSLLLVVEEKAVTAAKNGAIADNGNSDRLKDAIVESSDATFISSNGKKTEEDNIEDGEIGGIGKVGAEKNNSDAEGNYKKIEESTTLSDKEASSEETDQFVDAKSSTQIDDTSADGAIENSDETKEQMEDIQDEEIYEYDEEEQDGEPDDDEVEGNPAFIPKSGRYYMHDSRNTDEERAPEPSSHSRADGKWKHDRFDERSQRPKTKRELMNRYGYDIRNENKNNGDGNVNAPTTHSNQTRGASRGGSSGGGNRGRHSNRGLPQLTQHQSYDRRDHRRPVQNSGAGRPAIRGGRKGEHHGSMNNQREQHGTKVFKNSPVNAQKGNVNRTDNHRSHDRSEEYLRDNRQNNRARGATGASGGDATTAHSKSGAHTGGKRYSTQRLATNFAPNIHQPPPLQPPPLQPTPTTGPIPIPPPDWRPPTYRGPPPPSTVPPPSAVPPPPPPPPIAIPTPVPNFRPSDIVYFDPQPQQMYRNPNPIPPRTKKRLEIVPPYQAKNP